MRDFTYIDDIAEGTLKILDKSPKKSLVITGENSGLESNCAPYKIYNIGNNKPVKLMKFIECLENSLRRKAEINFMPMQPGDVAVTYADIDDLKRDFDFEPKIALSDGIDKWADWYLKNEFSKI